MIGSYSLDPGGRVFGGSHYYLQQPPAPKPGRLPRAAGCPDQLLRACYGGDLALVQRRAAAEGRVPPSRLLALSRCTASPY